MKSSDEFPSSFLLWWRACFFLRKTVVYATVSKLRIVTSPLKPQRRS